MKEKAGTYYVSTASAARMVGLLGKLPTVQVRNQPKGITVRRGGPEWYFEKNDAIFSAAKSPTQGKATAIDNPDRTVADANMGTAKPNTAVVELHGFRGVREIGGTPLKSLPAEKQAEVKSFTDRHPLLWAGHIGISLNGGSKIFGFTPHVPEGVALGDFMARLKGNEAFPGVVGDDTAVFRIAASKHANEKWNTEVEVVSELVQSEKKLEVVDKVMKWSGMKPGEHGKSYAFPLPKDKAQGGNHFVDQKGVSGSDQANCATFPAMVGVEIPDSSGVLGTYMPALSEWAKSGIRDNRGNT